MDLKTANELINNKLGLRVKETEDYIIIYGNGWTFIVDIYKWIKNQLTINK